MNYAKLYLLICLVLSGFALQAGGESEGDGLVQVNGYWYLMESGVRKGPIVPDRIVVRRDDRAAVTQSSMLARGYTSISSISKPIAHFFHVIQATGSSTFNLYSDLKADSSFDLVEYDVVSFYTGSEESLNAQVIPDDCLFDVQDNIAQHRLPEAWTITAGDPSVVVANLDSGVKISHPDLIDNIWVNQGEDFNHNGVADFFAAPLGDLDGIDNDNNGYIDDVAGWNFMHETNRPFDIESDHGTLIAGIISARTNNSEGISGFAGGWGSEKGISMMAIRIFQTGVSQTTWPTAAGLLQALEYSAELGARVANISNGWGDEAVFFTEGLADIMEQYDIIIAASSGNSSTGEQINFPARYPDVIAVGMSNQFGVPHTGGYSKGLELDLIARSSVWTTGTGNCGSCALPGHKETQVGCYQTFGGTSAASPEVSATLGLMLSVDPELSRDRAMFILQATAAKGGMGSNYFTCQSGYGTMDTYAAVAAVAFASIPENVSLSQPLSSTVVKAFNTITTSSNFRVNSGQNVVLHSLGSVTLSPGTIVSSGSNVRIDVGYHENCPTVSGD